MPVLQKIRSALSWEALVRFLLKHSILLFILGIALTVLSFQGISRLKIDSDYMAFLPDDFPGVQNLKKVIQKTGSFGNFILVTEGATPEVRRRYAEEFARKAEALPWVDYAEYKKGWDKIEKNKFLYVSPEDLTSIHDRIRHHIESKKNPFVISFLDDEEGKSEKLSFDDIERKYQNTSFGTPYFEDPDLKYTVALIWPKGSMTKMDFSIKAYEDLKRLLNSLPADRYDPTLTVELGGEFRSKVDEYYSIKGNVLGSGLLTLGVIFALLISFYRRPGAVFYTIIPLVMGTIWTCGLAYVLVGRLNLMTVFLVGILFGVGIDYGIYLFSEYSRDRAAGKSLEEALKHVLTTTGSPILNAGLTTAAAFGTLCFTNFKGFQEFGLLAGLGIVTLLVAYLVFSPVVWILAERLGIGRMKKINAPRLWLPRLPMSRGFVIGGFIVALMALLSIPFVSFEYDYAKLKSTNNAYYKVKSKIHAVFPLSKTPAVIVTDTLEESRTVVAAVKELIPKVKTVDTVKSIGDLLPSNVDEKKTLLGQIEKLLLDNRKLMGDEDWRKVEDFLPYLHPTEMRLEDLPRGVLRQFSGLKETPGYLVMIYDKVRLSDARNAIQYANDIREIKAGGKTYYPAEGSLIFADALTLMQKEAFVAFLIMLVMVYGALSWELKSFSEALIVFTPISMGFVLTLGIMAWLGVRLNIFNLVVFPILMGMADDSSLHLYSHFRHRDPTIPLNQSLRLTGNSILLATLAAMAGFGSMFLSDHMGLRSLAEVAVIGLASILIVNIFFFPAFLNWFHGRRLSL